MNQKSCQEYEQELQKLRGKYIYALERYQRLLKLLEMEQENTQKFIDLFDQAQKDNNKLQNELDSICKTNHQENSYEYRR